jgi:dihydrofolate reductase
MTLASTPPIRQAGAMGKIHVHEFISLDGVIDTPSWTADYAWDDAMGARIGAVCGTSQGILLGRTTFEMFAPAWSTRTAEDDPGAPFFNDTTKFVVSSTVTSDEAEAAWANSVSVGAYDPAVIRRTADEVGDLYVSGSGTLVRQMLADGLVDALHLCVFPTVRGGGPRLFPEGVEPFALERTVVDAYDNGVMYVQYRSRR